MRCFRQALRGVEFLLAAGVFAAPAHAAIREVPQQYPSIQQAVDAAAPGDTIVVHPKPNDEPYRENVLLKPSLTLVGYGAILEVDDPRNYGDKTAVVCLDDTVVTGFKQINGRRGLGVRVAGHRVRIHDNVLIGRLAVNPPFGKLAKGVVIERNGIHGLFIRQARNIVVRQNLISGRVGPSNSLPAVVINYSEVVSFLNNTVLSEGTSPLGVFIPLELQGLLSHIHINNCIFHPTLVPNYPATPDIFVNVNSGSSDIQLWHSLLRTGVKGTGLTIREGNLIGKDPLFTSDYHLQPGSPALDSGDCKIHDLNGSRSDRGAFGGELGYFRGPCF